MKLNSQLDHSKEIEKCTEIARSGFVNTGKLLCHPKIISGVFGHLATDVWEILAIIQEDILSVKLARSKCVSTDGVLRIKWANRTTDVNGLTKMITSNNRDLYHRENTNRVQRRIEGKQSIGRKKNHA